MDWGGGPGGMRVGERRRGMSPYIETYQEEVTSSKKYYYRSVV